MIRVHARLGRPLDPLLSVVQHELRERVVHVDAHAILAGHDADLRPLQATRAIAQQRPLRRLAGRDVRGAGAEYAAFSTAGGAGGQDKRGDGLGLAGASEVGLESTKSGKPGGPWTSTTPVSTPRASWQASCIQ